MIVYDAERPPQAAWVAAGSDDRLAAVLRYHERLGGRHAAHPAPALHARLHLTVEAQSLAGHPAVIAALERFAAAGVVRHEAVHAIGTSFAEALREALATGHDDADAAFSGRLGALRPEEWLARAIDARLGRRGETP